jgi:hypothetical protein
VSRSQKILSLYLTLMIASSILLAEMVFFFNFLAFIWIIKRNGNFSWFWDVFDIIFKFVNYGLLLFFLINRLFSFRDAKIGICIFFRWISFDTWYCWIWTFQNPSQLHQFLILFNLKMLIIISWVGICLLQNHVLY